MNLLHRLLLHLKGERIVLQTDSYCSPILEGSKKDLIRELILKLSLNKSCHRSCSKDRIKSLGGKPLTCRLRNVKSYVTARQLSLQLFNEFMNNLQYHR